MSHDLPPNAKPPLPLAYRYGSMTSASSLKLYLSTAIASTNSPIIAARCAFCHMPQTCHKHATTSSNCPSQRSDARHSQLHLHPSRVRIHLGVCVPPACSAVRCGRDAGLVDCALRAPGVDGAVGGPVRGPEAAALVPALLHATHYCQAGEPVVISGWCCVVLRSLREWPQPHAKIPLAS
jgi:hypothetical protein